MNETLNGCSNETLNGCLCSWHEFEPGENERDIGEGTNPIDLGYEPKEANGAMMDRRAPLSLSQCADDSYTNRIATMQHWHNGIGKPEVADFES